MPCARSLLWMGPPASLLGPARRYTPGARRPDPRDLAQMPQLLAPVTPPSATRVAQPSLRIGDERSPLPPGSHALGGRAADAVPLEALGNQPRAAILTVSANG